MPRPNIRNPECLGKAAIGEAIPHRDNSCDIVFCCDVLEHVRDVLKVIAEISRVLVMISVPGLGVKGLSSVYCFFWYQLPEPSCSQWPTAEKAAI